MQGDFDKSWKRDVHYHCNLWTKIYIIYRPRRMWRDIVVLPASHWLLSRNDDTLSPMR